MTFPFVFFASALLALFASILCVLVIRRIPAVAALVYLFAAALTAAVTAINWQGGFSPGQLVFDFTIITGQAMLGAIVGALPASLWLKSRARRG
ncbi:MAG: hypothetical protein RL274_1565 [Pseudomonadota bacterium]